MTEQNSATHAMAGDFCRIFEYDMKGLYLLSFLLTADRAMAEKCFAGGLEDAVKNTRVFKEWARSWARRMIVQNAIQEIHPQPRNNHAINHCADYATSGAAEISAVLELSAFERFVFVLSVLEGYSDQDCALLLDSTRGNVIAARLSALQQIASFAEGHRALNTAGADLDGQLQKDVANLALRLNAVPHRATAR